MNDPIYYLEIEEGDGLTQVSLVNSPAIELDFHYFSAEQFVTPTAGESEEEFIGRCVPILIGEGKEQEQAVAICYSYWEDKTAMASFSDYPEAAKANAERGIRLNEEGGNKCATQVGKVRAQQIAGGEPLSEETIQRTYSFLSRAKEYYNPNDDAACGTISYLLWGGEEMLRWCESKLNQIEKMAAGEKVSFDYDDTLSTARGKEKAAEEIASGSTVYIISARNDKESMLGTADELGIPHDRVYATGSNEAKIAKVAELGIDKHYDNNPDVVSALGDKGVKFYHAFAIQSEERRIITGPAMIAEKPILRRAEDGSTYYVKFSAETIRKAVKLWALQNKYNAVNAEHANPVGGMHLLESFIVDKERGINAPQAWADAPEGSWFLSYYVEDDAVWADIKAGKFRGFSIEGYFTDKPADPAEETLAAMRSILSKCDTLNINTLSEMNALNKIQEIKKLLGFSDEPAAPELKFSEDTLVDGTVIRYPGDSPVVGDLLEVQAPDGTFVPAPDGTHETSEGYMITTANGLITEIVEKQETPAAPVAQSEDFASIKAEFESKLAAQDSAIAKLTAAIENLTNAQAKTVEVLEQFSAIPAEEPAKPVAKVNAKEAALARFSENLKNLKANK